jgi:DNA repair exonuclease SbcCD nuclease subunit
MYRDLNYMITYKDKREKWLIVGDVHWSEYSSIYRKRGMKYSKRLESLINTLNWIEEIAEQSYCTKIIFLGDMFDRNDLNANEITALQEVVWSHIPHVFLVGNHEGLLNDLSTSSAHLLNLIPNATVIDQPSLDYGFGYSILYLPYILESERKSMIEYYKQCNTGDYFITQEVKKRIVFSHNDLKMQYGAFESKIGFELSELAQCDFFVNGHIHNFTEFGPTCINLGNICGQNFSENAKHYPHHIMLLDPETLDYAYQENPFALNFYKFDVMSVDELNKELAGIKDNAIMSIKAPQSIISVVKQILESNEKIKEYRVITLPEVISDSGESLPNTDVIEAVNHLDEFIKFVKENMDFTEVVQTELTEVCK